MLISLVLVLPRLAPTSGLQIDYCIFHYHQIRITTIKTPGSMSLLNCEIYQRGRVPRVADTEFIILIARDGSIPKFQPISIPILEFCIN